MLATLLYYFVFFVGLWTTVKFVLDKCTNLFVVEESPFQQDNNQRVRDWISEVERLRERAVAHSSEWSSLSGGEEEESETVGRMRSMSPEYETSNESGYDGGDEYSSGTSRDEEEFEDEEGNIFVMRHIVVEPLGGDPNLVAIHFEWAVYGGRV